MKYWISPYSLNYNLRGKKQKTSGFYIKVQASDYKVGYGSCHVWESLGDLAVGKQINSLRESKPTRLVEASLHYAKIDGEAREREISLLQGLAPKKNHKTILSMESLSDEYLHEIYNLGFTKVKVKVDGTSEASLEHLCSLIIPDKLKLRLDFNTTGVEKFFKKTSNDFLSKIEFIEDPCPYNAEAWERIFCESNVSLAYDQPSLEVDANPFCHYKVYKPIKLAQESVSKNSIPVFTHYLDSDFGQRCGFWQASNFGPQKTEWGFLPVSWNGGPEFCFEVDGFGFGKDDYMKALSWESL